VVLRANRRPVTKCDTALVRRGFLAGLVPRGSAWRAQVTGIVVGLAAVLAVTVALLPFRSRLSRAVPALVLVIPVVIAAVMGRRVAALVTALAGAAFFSFSFVPPYDRVSIASAEDWVALAVFLLVAMVLGTVVAKEAERRQSAEERSDEIHRLYERNEQLVVERERLREEANRVALMERVDEQRSALLRSVSHDLRTPLATIRTVTSELRDGPEYSATARDQLLDLVGDEAERLNRLVENLLSLSRIESGALQPDYQAVALDEMFDDRVRKLERLLRHVRVEVDLPLGLPLVHADYMQLDQVVSNLLENAARHAPPGSTVRVSARARGDMVEVAVEDEGEGVSAEERDRIFEPFRRSHGSSSSGVGLAICKAILEAHGGVVGVQQAEGGGARFWFTVRAERAERAETEVAGQGSSVREAEV
jgi:K+-sensing histidine kinase KdpD